MKLLPSLLDLELLLFSEEKAFASEKLLLFHNEGSVVLFASAQENVFFEVDVCLGELRLRVLYPFIVYVYAAALEVFFRILARC